MNAANGQTQGALTGVKVLDFTSLYPGPLATMLLADLGAEVIRVDSPSRPDLLRYLPPVGDDEVGAAFRTLGRNKRSITLNLKHPTAPAVVGRLAAHVDVVIEQFRPGVMERLGIGYEQLRLRRPDLIYCAITSYGQTGPRRSRAGHDINFLATAGLASTMGRRGQGPTPLATLVGDVAGGTWPAVAGILAALFQRERTGAGQMVDISMTDGALLMNAMAVTQALQGAGSMGPEEHVLSGASVYDYYRTADDRWLAVGALEDKFYHRFLSALGLDKLADYWMAQGQDAAEQKAAVAQAISRHPLSHWRRVFADVDCCVEPALTAEEAIEDEMFAERGMIVEVPREGASPARQVGNPIRMSGSPARYDHVGPLPGQDTDLVLASCGFDADEISRFREAGLLDDRLGA